MAIIPIPKRAIEALKFALTQPVEYAEMRIQTRAFALARCGRHTDAVATPDRLRELAADDPSNLATIARTCAVAFRAVAAGQNVAMEYRISVSA